MRTIMLACALACALAPVAPVAASAAAGDSMKTRGTYQTHSLRCLVSGRGQTNSIIVFNQAIGRVPKGAVIELRVRTAPIGSNRLGKHETTHTRIAHSTILRGNGIRVAGVPDARTCAATVKLGPLTSLVR